LLRVFLCLIAIVFITLAILQQLKLHY
jgi:hypothetical protein